MAAKPNAAPSTPTPLTLDERIAITTAPAWKPKDPDAPKRLEKVTVIGLVMMTGSEYGDYPKIVYRQTDGSYIAFHAFHTIPRERLAELGTTIGSVQNIAYLGTMTSNKRVDSNGDPQHYESFYIENEGDEVKLVDDNFAF